MAANTFDFDRIATLEKASEKIEQVNVVIKRGAEGYLTVAQAVGAENLLKTANGQMEATEQMMVLGRNWLESNEALIKKYKALQAVQEG